MTRTSAVRSLARRSLGRPSLGRPSLGRRRVAGLCLLATAIAVPVLTGCEAGQNAPTLTFHPAAGGGYTTAPDGVSISNAFVLGPALNAQLPKGDSAGLFVSISSENGDTLESVTAPGAAGSVKLDGGSVTIPAGGAANLTGPSPKIVLDNLAAPLAGGGTVTLYFTFANAGTVPVQVPVQPHAYAYATYDTPASTTSTTTGAGGTASASLSASKHKKAQHGKTPHHASASASASPSPSVTP